MNRLPKELLYEITYNLDYQQLSNLRLSSRKFNNICTDDYFWQQRVVKNYGLCAHPIKISWRKYYQVIYNFIDYYWFFINYVGAFIENNIEIITTAIITELINKGACQKEVRWILFKLDRLDLLNFFMVLFI